MLMKEAMNRIYYLINIDGNHQVFDKAVTEIINDEGRIIGNRLTFEEVTKLLTIVDRWYRSDQFITEDKLKKYRTVVFKLIILSDTIDEDSVTKFLSLVACDIIPFYLFISHNMGDLIADRTKIKFFDHYFNIMKYGKEYNK